MQHRDALVTKSRKGMFEAPRPVRTAAVGDAKGAVAGLRPSIWLQHLGVKYIDTAFRLAHEADPMADLVINEYDIECVGEQFTARRQALLTLVRDLRARGVPLHGVGLQGHIKGKYQIDSDGLY